MNCFRLTGLEPHLLSAKHASAAKDQRHASAAFDANKDRQRVVMDLHESASGP